MNTTEPTPEGSKRSKAKGNRILYCESCKEYKAENADLRAVLAELLPLVEVACKNCEVDAIKSAIERAKLLINDKDNV